MRNRVEPDSTWSDAELVRACQAGVTEAWDILYLRHWDRLQSFFFRQGIRNPEDVKDLVQETLLEAMINIAQNKKPERFSGWLNRIAIGTMGRWLEKEDKRREAQESFAHVNELAETGEFLSPTHQGPEQITINKEHVEIVFSLIEKLPPSQKEAFRLYFDGMKNIEVAEKLGIKASTVNVRIYKAQKKMRAWLEDEYPEVLADLENRGII